MPWGVLPGVGMRSEPPSLSWFQWNRLRSGDEIESGPDLTKEVMCVTKYASSSKGMWSGKTLDEELGGGVVVGFERISGRNTDQVYRD